MTFELHPQLSADCFEMGLIKNGISHCTLLLHKNALLPWFILVPHTNQTEIFKIEETQQKLLHKTINQLAEFVDTSFKPDKLNIATLGNIVPQLHMHIIGRYKNDFCWPQPVWGQSDACEYSDEKRQSIKQLLIDKMII